MTFCHSAAFTSSSLAAVVAVGRTSWAGICGGSTTGGAGAETVAFGAAAADGRNTEIGVVVTGCSPP